MKKTKKKKKKKKKTKKKNDLNPLLSSLSLLRLDIAPGKDERVPTREPVIEDQRQKQLRNPLKGDGMGEIEMEKQKKQKYE